MKKKKLTPSLPQNHNSRITHLLESQAQDTFAFNELRDVRGGQNFSKRKEEKRRKNYFSKPQTSETAAREGRWQELLPCT